MNVVWTLFRCWLFNWGQEWLTFLYSLLCKHLEVLNVCWNSMWGCKARDAFGFPLSSQSSFLKSHLLFMFVFVTEFGWSSDGITCTFHFPSGRWSSSYFWTSISSDLISAWSKDLHDQWVWKGWNYKWCHTSSLLIKTCVKGMWRLVKAVFRHLVMSVKQGLGSQGWLFSPFFQV